MPYINIRVTDEQVTQSQKRQLIEGVTQLMVDILNKNPKTTHVVIDDFNSDTFTSSATINGLITHAFK